MADEQLIKPRELPPALEVYANDAIMTDDGVTVGRATPAQIVNAGAPVATEAEALAGTNNSKRMTPLRVMQVVTSEAIPAISRAQAWAESPNPPDPAQPASKSSKTWADESLTSAARAEAAATLAESVAAGSGPLYETRDDFLASNRSREILRAGYKLGGRSYWFVRDDDGPVSASDGRWIPDGSWMPGHWGAVGDGAADDGAALNAALGAYRNAIDGVAEQNGSLIFDGGGLIYRSTVSLDFTHVISWGWKVQNMTIYSEAEGKTAFDMIGSRGGSMSKVMITGSRTKMPRVGFMAARSAAGGRYAFCDHVMWDDCNTRGFFSLTGFWAYGQESSIYNQCEFWNLHYAGHTAITVGYDVYPVESEYVSAITGPTSHINNIFTRCDFRHLPSAGFAAVNSIYYENPLRVEVDTAILFSVGDVVVLGGDLAISPQFINLKATITAISGTTVTFSGVDASAWTGATTGGIMARSQTVSSLLVGRCAGIEFESCYAVNYGTHHVELVWGDMPNIAAVKFNNFLGEGSGVRSILHLNIGASDKTLTNFAFKTYQGNSRESIISVNRTGAAKVKATGSDFDIANLTANITVPLFAEPSAFDLRGSNLYVGSSDILFSSAALAGRPVYAWSQSEMIHRESSGITYGTPKLAPLSGSTISIEYLNVSGDIVGRQSHASGNFSWAPDGTASSFAMGVTSLYPLGDTQTRDLGLNTQQYRTVYARRFRSGDNQGIDGTFTSQDGKTITVSGGIISGIS